jgi:iron(III) transport system substrate-binding protein
MSVTFPIRFMVLTGFYLFSGLGTLHAQDISALVAAAKKEPPLTVYDSTGKIRGTAAAFSKKYGIKATGVKVSSDDQVELILREAKSGSTNADVIALSDVASAQRELFPKGVVKTYLPPALAGDIPKKFQNPLVMTRGGAVFTYNTELNPKGCPFDNIWALTEPEFKGGIIMRDPLRKAVLTDWFNQMATHADKQVSDAYEARYGKKLDIKGESATALWVKALAANGPLLTNSDGRAADTVGAPGVATNLVGLFSAAKFRDNAKKGYKLGLCENVSPFIGFVSPKLLVIAAGTDSPNAAKLMVHYLMTPEGIAPQVADGKISSNTKVKIPENEPSGIAKVLDRVYSFTPQTASDDWNERRNWQDLWRLNYRRRR